MIMIIIMAKRKIATQDQPASFQSICDRYYECADKQPCWSKIILNYVLGVHFYFYPDWQGRALLEDEDLAAEWHEQGGTSDWFQIIANVSICQYVKCVKSEALAMIKGWSYLSKGAILVASSTCGKNTNIKRNAKAKASVTFKRLIKQRFNTSK